MVTQICAPDTNCPIQFWNRRSWRTIGTTQGGLGYGLAIVKNGPLWCVGGPFDAIDGVPMKGAASWDGSRWTGLGDGVPGTIQVMTSYKDELYAAGWAADPTKVLIQKWNGSTWIDLGTSEFSGGASFALTTDGVYLYVGGDFKFRQSNVARWDGVSWSAVGQGIDTGSGYPVRSLAAYQNEIYAVAGPSFNLTGALLDSLWKWNGTAWLRVDATFQGKSLGPLAVWKSSLYLSGNFTNINGTPAASFARYDGFQFQPIAGGGSFSVLSPSQTALYVSGGFTYLAADPVSSNFLLAPGVGSWDGTSLNHLYGPDSSNGAGLLVESLGEHKGNLYAGGTFYAVGNVSANGIAAWNTLSWQPLGQGLEKPNRSAPVHVNAITSWGDDLFVGGSFDLAGGWPASNVAIWDGSSWRPAGAGLNGTVVQILEYNGRLVATGGFTKSGLDSVGYVAAWNGSGWEEIGCCLSAPAGGSVTEAAVLGGSLFVGGRLAGGGAAYSVYELVDGEFLFRGGFDAGIGALATVNGEIYVGGDFKQVNGQAIPYFAKWDGNSWSSVGSPLDHGVSIITSHKGKLHIGGLFTRSTSVAGLNGIARLEDDWQPLGSGLKNAAPFSSKVVTLLSLGDDLFAGGVFIQSGTADAYYIARWNDTVDFYSSPTISLSIEVDSQGNIVIQGNVPVGTQAILEISTDLLNWSEASANFGNSRYVFKNDGPRLFLRSRSVQP